MFPVLKAILHKITNYDVYKSPTDMGVNMIGFCIKNDKIIQEAAKKEIMRRYYQEMGNYKKGLVDEDVPQKVKMLINELNIDENILEVVEPCLKKAKKENKLVISLKLPNGKIITGKQTDLLSPASSLILNAIKEMSNIPDEIKLLSPTILEPILKFKNSPNSYETTLQLPETFIALSISSVTNPMVEQVMSKIGDLEGCEAHASYMLKTAELRYLQKLKINLTCEPVYYSDNLY